ncbi:MAG TPA: hypothetical protein VEA58_06150 [Anaerovoracaceae bacterium]|nr:hypothetical protein [Anaerovoracaceae bacterium]
MIMRRNIVVGVTALAVVLSSGAIAFAATDTNYSQADKSRPVIMSSLTEVQRDAVRQAHTDSLTEAIAALVDSDAITQEEADKLTEIRVVQKEKCKTATLTDEQRTALHEEQKAEFERLLADLVDEGTLTQEQAEQMEQGKGVKRGLDLTEEQMEAVMQAKISGMKAAAANLVDEGTITQEEADAISVMPVKTKVAGNGPESILTEDQRTALKETVKTNLETKLADLVDDGTLTQELADQLLNNGEGLRMGPGGKHGQGFGGRSGTDVQRAGTESTNL